MELFERYFNVWYTLAIIFGGKIITNDRVVGSLPFWIKGIFLRISMEWRILIYSAILGIGIDYFNPEIGRAKLFLTYIFATSMYELLLKGLLNWIENLLNIVRFINIFKFWK